MKSLIRILALWLVLAALPFQGFASASMLRYGDSHSMQVSSAGSGGSGDAGAHCAAGKQRCAMGDCCVGAALAYAVPHPVSHPRLAERIRPPEPMPPPPVVLALRKRPPRPVLA